MTHGTEGHELNEPAIAEFMARVAALPVTSALPDPMHAWWKAQLLERWSRERRARLPITVMQPIEIAASLIGAAWLFYSSLLYLLRA
jgi:hypothetical protein